MKLSRLSLILGLAAALGLTMPSKQVFCQSGEQSQSQSADPSGSPSYQAAQSYDSFDCFYAGCHADYGDVLPELNTGETNASEEVLPTTPSSEDADLPGDDPASRGIPVDVTSTPSPLPSHGLIRPEEEVSHRGVFAPGYPHPGYQHPGYGYSPAVNTSKVFLNADQSIQSEEVLDIADLQEEPVPPEPEEVADHSVEEALEAETAASESSPYGDDYDYGYGYGESYEYEYDYEAEYGEYVAEGSAEVNEEDAEDADPAESEVADAADVDELEEEDLAEVEAEPGIQEEYTHYDDIYGYGSEWYGPYDATKVDTAEGSDADTETVTDASEADAPESEHTTSAQSVDPPIDQWLAESEAADAGPAELEVDVESAETFDEKDSASLNAAVKEAVDDWFYRETYGYGPRYDYDSFGYEDFPAESSAAQATLTHGPLAPKVTASEAESSFPWEYVYRLELGESVADVSEEASSVRIPFAAAKSEPQPTKAKPTANAPTVASQATTAHRDPTLPASVDFDPEALISTTQDLAKSLGKKPLLEEVQGLWKALTPMELARTALAAAPDRPRQSRSVLVPSQNPAKAVEAPKQSMQPAVALRDLAMLLDDAGQALLMLSHRVEALANVASPQELLAPSAPLQSRVPAEAELETR